MSLIFEWDPSKSLLNARKHGISFEEACSVFRDPLSLTIPEPQIRGREYRFVTIGTSNKGRILVVIHADRNDRIRLISARKSLPKERKLYPEN